MGYFYNVFFNLKLGVASQASMEDVASFQYKMIKKVSNQNVMRVSSAIIWTGWTGSVTDYFYMDGFKRGWK